MTTRLDAGLKWAKIAASRGAAGAVGAQVTQAAGSLALQALAAHLLGLSGLGRFAVLYGTLILMTALTTGFIGDSLTVLDRNHPIVRAGLQSWGAIIIGGVGVVAAALSTLAGWTSVVEGLVFALAAIAYTSEDLLRRLLMAEFRFWRICVLDVCAAATSVALILVLHFASLTLLLVALAIGQVVGVALGVVLLPRSQRWWSRGHGGGLLIVARFGVWRAAQQAIRPALLTALRSSVILVGGYTAAGGIEAARIYVAPAMLLVGGASSYLFADYARRGAAGLSELVRRADRTVLALAALMVAFGAVSVAVLSFVGPLLIGAPIALISVLGWLAYFASVAVVTPYGSLASVRGRQRWVFVVRVSDSLVSMALVGLLLLAAGPPSVTPALLAIGSVAGGLVIRFVLLAPHQPRSPLASTSLHYPPSEGAVPRVQAS